MQIKKLKEELEASTGLGLSDLLGHLEPLVLPERREKLLEVAGRRTNEVIPVLENIYDRGNTSAVMRSADAFGFYNMNIIEQPGAAFKAANRVTQGTDKWLHIDKFSDSTSCIKSLKSKGYKLYCTHLEASKPISEIDFTVPCAVVLGNEKDGVSDEMAEASDANFIIPMQGFAQSFNISVAGALSFYHIYESRCSALDDKAYLNEEDSQLLYLDYLIKTIGGLDMLNKLIKHKGNL